MATVISNEAYSPPVSELEVQMKQGSPDKCIALSHSAPSVQMFYALRTRLECSSEAWLQEFMDLDGLDSLLDSLCQMTGKGFTSFSDAILQLDCISCIRAILNTNVGLEYMVRHESYVPKLALALDIGNTLPKKQVFEMLSAICAYNSIGYHSVLSALSQIKRELDLAHRFSIVVNELKAAETVAHKTAILTFINCIINCTSDIIDRNRIRTEFMGIHLLDVLCFLRKEEIDDDLHLQLEIFHEKKHDDEEALSQDVGATDFNSPEDLIDIIQSKIFGSAKMASFVNILQDLLSIDMVYSKNSLKLWKVIEDQVHQTIHTHNTTEQNTETSILDLDTLPDHISVGLKYINRYQMESKSLTNQLLKKQSLWQDRSNFNGIDRTKYDNDTGVELTHNRTRYELGDNVTDIDFMDQSQCESVYLKIEESIDKPHTPTNKSALQRRYKIRRPPIPSPSKKLKNFKWVKLSDDAIDKHNNCIWLLSSPCQRLTPDYDQLEKLFQHNDSGFEDMEEVILLNDATRKNINLFLSRIEIGPEDLLQGLENGNSDVISQATLQYLQKVLPQQEEIETLQAFDGRRLDLGMPEQFVLLLADIPDYEVMIQGHVTKFAYTAMMQKLKLSIEVLVSMCKVVLDNQDLREFFHFVLNAGNFLNHGCLQGDAAGFKLSSLDRMINVKSNVPNRSLLHHIIKLAHQTDDTLLSFLKELLPLEKKTSVTLNDLKVEINNFNKDLCQFIQQLSRSCIKMRDRFQPFIEEVRTDFMNIQLSTMQLREMSNKMANYFCEDERKFNLEETLQSILKFCKLIRKCHNENATFYKQSHLAKRKTDQLKNRFKNKLLTLEFGKDAGASSSILEDKNKVLERILDDLHRGNFRPIIKSEVHTPETEIEPLEVSHISFIGSPFPLRPSCEALDDEEFFDTPLKDLKVRTSSAADILSEEPQLEKQEAVSKEYPEMTKRLNTEIAPKKRLDWSNSKPLNKSIDLIKTEASKGKSHNRSRSDLTDSILVTEKWMKYEEIRHKECLMEAPLAEPESMCAISTLNLENNGKFLDRDDVKHFEEHKKFDNKDNVCIVPEGPVLRLPMDHLQIPELRSEPRSKTKPEKRSSVSNFFNKISKAVLKPKNDQAAAGGLLGSKPQKERFGKFGRKKQLISSSDKENLQSDEMENQVDKKQASKENKRMKADKAKAAKLK